METLTATLHALTNGRLFTQQARIVLELTGACSETVAAEVDRRLHAGRPDLAGWTARRLRDRLRRLVLVVEADLDPSATAARQSAARARRRVTVRPEPDGMGSLWALLPAEQLRVFTVGLDELHRRQLVTDRATGIDRTADQRRADLIAMLPALALHALDGTSPAPAADGTCSHPALVLNVHLPMMTALGLSDEPATLDGYGPLSAMHARLLIPSASLRAVLVDETTGQPLHVDATVHPPRREGRRERRRSHRPAPPAAHTSAPGCDASTNGPPPAASPSTAPVGTRPPGPGPAGSRSAVGSVERRPGQPPAPRPAAERRTGADPRAACTPAGGIDLSSWLRLVALVPDEPVLVRDDPEPQHDPSTALARLVRLRDPLCTGPGCSQASRRSDLDHVVAWPLGPTTMRNLRPESRRCHRAKTVSWQVTTHDDGSQTWTSPTGRSYPVPAYWPPPPTPVGPRSGLPDRQARRDDVHDGLPELSRDLDQPVGDLPAPAPPSRPRLTLDEEEPPF